MLLTSNTINNQLTKNDNRFSPTTTLASSSKINDNDILHHPLTEATIEMNITPLIPPQKGEKLYEPRQKQSGPTAAIRLMSDINVPEKLHSGTVSSASRQPVLNYYHTIDTNKMNSFTNYPRGEDTEGGVIKQGYATPVLAKIVEPPEGRTSMPMSITRAIIIFNATVCHHGEERRVWQK